MKQEDQYWKARYVYLEKYLREADTDCLQDVITDICHYWADKENLDSEAVGERVETALRNFEVERED